MFKDMAAAPSPWRIHALGLVTMGAITSFMVTSPVIPLYLDRLGLPPFHVGGIIGAMSLALIVSEALALSVSSRLGRRMAVIVGLAGSAVMLAWFPLVGSLAGLYLTRLGLGAVRGVLWPVAFAEVAEAGPPDRRPALFALFWLYFGIGLLIGPALGGWIGERISLTMPFFVGAIASLVTILGVGAVQPVRDKSPNPLVAYAALLRSAPSIARVWLLIICNTIVFGVFTTFLPLHASAKGLSTSEIGLIFTGGGVAFIVAQALLGRITERVSAEQLLFPSFLIRGIGVGIIPFLESFPTMFFVNFLSALLGAAIPLALSTRVTSRSPQQHLVAAMGGLNAAADLGFFVGPVLGGILALWGVQWAFAIVPLVTITALMLLRADTLRLQPEAG